MRAPTPLRFLLSSLIILVCATACAGNKPTQTQTPAAEAPRFNRVERMEFNRRAAALFLPVFWRADDDNDGDLDPSELAVLWGVSNEPATTWIANGSFTPAFVAGYGTIEKGVSTAGLLADEKARRDLVLQELGQGRPTLILTDLAKGSPEDKAIVTHILTAARWIERIYAKQNGVWGLAEKMAADDTASKALYFRNQGPFCEAPKTEKDPACNALADKPKKLSGIYPDEIQADPKFCEVLEKRKDEKALLGPFVVVRYPETVDAKIKKEGKAATDTLVPVPYTVAYAEEMKAISDELRSAAAAVVDPQESAFKAYLEAAAGSFVSNDWVPADTAWAAMNATNSKWYLRIGPDEVYFEPCSRKAGFHVSFARINQDSLAWQKKLDPVKKELEAEAAGLAGPPYKARDVGFHLPDFIDIVVNAGDSRNAHGATIGQSLPNWGPVAEKGGRTVAMTNFYTDKDSQAALLEQTASLFCKATMDQVDPDPKHGTMSTVLHEAAHNLGPAHSTKSKARPTTRSLAGRWPPPSRSSRVRPQPFILPSGWSKRRCSRTRMQRQPICATSRGPLVTSPRGW